MGAALMYIAAMRMGSGASPGVINTVLFGYMLTYFPTLALTNTLAIVLTLKTVGSIMVDSVMVEPCFHRGFMLRPVISSL